MSDDGRHGLTVIAFIGSVFSPYYALARRRGRRADPYDHCAFNVALYGASGARWAMTERGRSRLSRDETSITIGPSSIVHEPNALVLDLDEVCVPIPKRVRGRIKVSLDRLEEVEYRLDPEGLHRWRPLAPRARIEVVLECPDLAWSGWCYVDSNHGDVALEDTFVSWTWSRAHLQDAAAILYEASRRDGETTSLALRFAPDGCRSFDPPPPASLPRTLFRVARDTRADPGAVPAVVATFEDAPFYARSLLRTRLLGEDVLAVHESLSLDRFRAPWTQMMLPFRMPRRA